MVEALRIGTFEPRGAANKEKVTTAFAGDRDILIKMVIARISGHGIGVLTPCSC
jgi:hypothetical protein